MHIHVRNGEGEAKFWLTPTVYLADSDGFDARTLRDLRIVVAANKDLIERTWNVGAEVDLTQPPTFG
jgi:hypothetical protein